MNELVPVLIWGAVASCVLCLLQRIAMWLSISRGPQPGGQAGFSEQSPHTVQPANAVGDWVAAGAGLYLFLFFLLLCARPGAAALLTTALGVLLVALNRAKEDVLREPAVLADTWLLLQAVKYPHLYFPFLPMKAIAAGAIATVLLVGWLVSNETGLLFPHTLHGSLLLAGLLGAPLLVLLLLRRGKLPALASYLLARCPVSHSPSADARRNGPLASALMHPVLRGNWQRRNSGFPGPAHVRPAQSHWPEPFETLLQQVQAAPPQDQPHVVMVQAESFCDIATLLPPEKAALLPNFLPNWNAMKAKARTLPTPGDAFGAYTMRTEFTMLTGLAMHHMGPWALNPYLLAARQPTWSLARLFAGLGYETLCVHPYHKDFFQRDKVMHNFGFQHFADIETLRHLPTFGPYTSDIALAQWVQTYLQQSTKPVFCFVITMEAHGPWLPGRLTEDQIQHTLGNTAKNHFSPAMQQYLCHLKNMDTAFATYSAPLQYLGATDKAATAPPRNSFVVGYGDHPPGVR